MNHGFEGLVSEDVQTNPDYEHLWTNSEIRFKHLDILPTKTFGYTTQKKRATALHILKTNHWSKPRWPASSGAILRRALES